MSRFSHQVSEQRMKCLGERIWRRCVTQSSFRLYKSEELAIHFLWLFSICNSECLALQCFSARRCPYIKGIYFAPWLPFIVSGTSITWTHTAEGPNMQGGDDGILNKYCNWAAGPFFMCCVYLLRPDGRFTRASIQCFYLEVCVCACVSLSHVMNTELKQAVIDCWARFTALPVHSLGFQVTGSWMCRSRY